MASYSSSGNKDDAQTIKYSGDGWIVDGGKGDDIISGSGNNIVFLYTEGDGNDSISGFNETSTLRISNGSSNVSSVTSGSDVVVSVGNDKITLVGAAALSTINIVTNDNSVVAVNMPGGSAAPQFYETLQDAVNAVDTNNDYRNRQITLLKDATGTLDLSGIANNKVSIDIKLEGNTFTATNTIKLSNSNKINVSINGGTITSTGSVSTLIESNGNFVKLDNVTIDATKLTAGGYIANVTGGQLQIGGHNTTVNSNNGVIRNAGGQLNIQGSCTVNADILLSGSSFTNQYSLILNDKEINGNLLLDSAALNAGALEKVYMDKRASFAENADVTADNISKLIANQVGGSDTYTVALPDDPPAGKAASLIVNGEITYYDSLADAMTAAAQSTTNGTLTLLKDFTGELDFSNFVHNGTGISTSYQSSDSTGGGGQGGNPGNTIGKFEGCSVTYGSGRFIFDLNGHTLAATNTVNVGSDAWVIIKNGNVTTSGAIDKIFEVNGGELDLQSVNVDATKLAANGYIATNSGGVLTFENNTTVDSNYATIKSTDGQLRIGNSSDTTIKANILLGSDEPNSQVIPFNFGGGKIDGDLLLDASALNANILSETIDWGGGTVNKICLSEEAVFTKYPALTEERQPRRQRQRRRNVHCQSCGRRRHRR